MTFNNNVYNINGKFYVPKERKTEREEFQELYQNKM